jgi:xanthine dioxygenase
MISDGLKLPLEDLPPINESKIQILPIYWRNPVTRKYALQIHPSAVKKIHLKDKTVVDDLERVRVMVYMLQRPVITP